MTTQDSQIQVNHAELTAPDPATGESGRPVSLADTSSETAVPSETAAPSETDATRRHLLRKGVKLAFVSPIVTSFLASQARAAGSNLSCYPTGQACGDEECCNGPCNLGVCP